MGTETPYKHIELDEKGIPFIVGTTMKVKELVAERLAWGWRAEEMLVNHPHLTLGQIYSALAYYADHQFEIEADMKADAVFVEKLREYTEPALYLSL